MAIALDVASNGTATTTSPLTWNHTVTASSSNRILIVGVVLKTSGSASLSAPTYNSVAMTLVGSQRVFNTNNISALYYLVNPATGTYAVSIAFSGTSPTCNAGAVSWTGVKQSNQPDAVTGSASQSSANPTESVTVVVGNSWTVGICGDGASLTAGLTSRWTDAVSTVFGSLEDSNGAVTSGAHNVNWTASSSTWSAQAASFAPDTLTLPAISDADTVTESLGIVGPRNIVVSETEAITESVTTNGPQRALSVFDSESIVDRCILICGLVSGGYQYSASISIDYTKVGTINNTDQLNFPFLFSGTYANLATTTNGGHVQNANGYDVIFTSDAAGNNLLSFEQEYYDGVHGTVSYWISIPTVSHTQNTVIYMFYGNSSISTFQSIPANAWNSNYVGVWHFPNGTSLTAYDSLGIASGSITGATATTGQIDGAGNFPQPNTNINMSNSAAHSFTSQNFTVSAWIKPPTSGQTAYGVFVCKGLFSVDGWYFQVDASTNRDGLNFVINSAQTAVATCLTLGSWNYVVAVRNGNKVYTYVGGADKSATQPSVSNPISNSRNLYIGRYDALGTDFKGGIDEVRISNTVRSADWIITEFNNQNNPSTFYTLGSETLSISVNDTDSSTDSPSIGQVDIVNVSDSESVTDVLSNTPPLIITIPISVNDGESATEDIQLLVTSYIHVNDSESVTDSPTAFIPALVLAVYDTEIVWENYPFYDSSGTTYGSATETYNGELNPILEITNFISVDDDESSRTFQVDTNGTLTNGLVVYYPMEGNSNDLYDSNPGIDVDVAYGLASGKIEQGASLNGISSFITSSLNSGITGDADFSISAWIRLNSIPTSLVSIAAFGITDAEGHVAVFCISGLTSGDIGLTYAGGNENAFTVGNQFSVGTWYHVVGTKSAGSIQPNSNIYINGVQVAADQGSGFVTPSIVDAPFYFGFIPGIVEYFPGDIDEVGIWNRVLTAQEIADLYNSNVGQTMVGLSEGVNVNEVYTIEVSDDELVTENLNINSLAISVNDSLQKAFQIDTNNTLTTDLVSYYKLEDTTDFWGSNDLINNSAVSFSAGKVNNAAFFDGTNYLSYGGAIPAVANTFSYSCWVYVPDVSINSTIFENGSYLDNQGFTLKIADGTDYYGNGNVFTYVIWSMGVHQASGPIGTGWHHFVITMDSSNNWKSYLDGVHQDAYDLTTAFAGTPATHLYLGATDHGELAVSGSGIDEFGAWVKVLSSQEIADLYNGDVGQTMTGLSEGVAIVVLNIINVSDEFKEFQVDAGGTLTNGLQYYYKFEGDSTDFFDSNDGSDNNIIYGNQYGIVNQGANFNGSDSNIQTSLTLPLSSWTGVTVHAWVNLAVLPNDYSRIICQETPPTNGGNFILRINPSNQFELFIGSDSFIVTNVTITDPDTVTEGIWYMVTGIWDGVTASLYVDGVSVGTPQSLSTTWSDDTTTLKFGCHGVTGNGSEFWNGDIDEAGIWNRALTDSEITDLYNGGVGQTLTIIEESVTIILPRSEGTFVVQLPFGTSVVQGLNKNYKVIYDYATQNVVMGILSSCIVQNVYSSQGNVVRL